MRRLGFATRWTCRADGGAVGGSPLGKVRLAARVALLALACLFGVADAQPVALLLAEARVVLGFTLAGLALPAGLCPLGGLGLRFGAALSFPSLGLYGAADLEGDPCRKAVGGDAGRAVVGDAGAAGVSEPSSGR